MNWQLIAKLKILKDRAASWAVLVNFFMIAYMFADKFENKFIGIIILIMAGLLITAISVIDYLYILPREQELYWQKNPEWQRR